MSRFELTLKGTPTVAARLARVEDLARNPRSALEVIGQTVIDDGVRRAFREQKSPDGTDWPALAASTLRAKVPGTNRRRRSYGGGKPLHRMGPYRNSWNAQVATDGQSVSIGTPLPHAKYHEQLPGSPAGKGIIPQRRALPVPGPDGALPAHVQAGIDEALDTLIERIVNA